MFEFINKNSLKSIKKKFKLISLICDIYSLLSYSYTGTHHALQDFGVNNHDIEDLLLLIIWIKNAYFLNIELALAYTNNFEIDFIQLVLFLSNWKYLCALHVIKIIEDLYRSMLWSFRVFKVFFCHAYTQS